MSYFSSAEFSTPGAVGKLDYPTPYFLFSKAMITKTVALYNRAFGGVELAYAMKSNSEPEVLAAIKDSGCSFEVASVYELDMLKQLDVPAERIICGTSVSACAFSDSSRSHKRKS